MAVLGCLTVACSGSTKASPTEFATLAPLASSTAHVGALSPVPVPTSASPSASPSAPPSPVPVDSAAQVIKAATTELSALYRAPLTRDSCLKDNPDHRSCIALTSSNSAIVGGVAAFKGGYPDGGGFAFLMGRVSDNGWHYWYGSQQSFYVLTNLPGDIRACGTGQPVTVRASADESSASVGSLPDGTIAHAKNFVLTTPGVPGVSGSRGDGWYQINSPKDGWVDARSTSDASLGDCKLRDAIEGAPPHG